MRPDGKVYRYNCATADHRIHISEAEAASDFAGLLARVRAGAEVVIENGKLPVAVIRPPAPPPHHLRVPWSESVHVISHGYYRVPIPERAIVCGLPTPLSVMATDPLFVPFADGVKTTLIVHP
jgi:antitoxin (DNA-binding transcriptional repressor) of toxin-antitoxin stability system